MCNQFCPPRLAGLNLRFWRTELSLETAKPHAFNSFQRCGVNRDPHRRHISRGAGEKRKARQESNGIVVPLARRKHCDNTISRTFKIGCDSEYGVETMRDNAISVFMPLWLQP